MGEARVKVSLAFLEFGVEGAIASSERVFVWLAPAGGF